VNVIMQMALILMVANLKSMQRGVSGELFMSDPSTSPLSSRSSSQRRNVDDVSPSELSPLLLDLHSFDTELHP
jgi:kinesin family protein 2/24